MEAEQTEKRARRFRLIGMLVSGCTVIWCAAYLADVVPRGPLSSSVGVLLALVASWLNQRVHGAGAAGVTVVTVRPRWRTLGTLPLAGLVVGVAALGALLSGAIAAIILAFATLVVTRELMSVRVSELGVHRSGSQIDRWSDIQKASCAEGRLSYLCPDGQQMVWRSVRLEHGLCTLLESWLPVEHPARAALRAMAA